MGNVGCVLDLSKKKEEKEESISMIHIQRLSASAEQPWENKERRANNMDTYSNSNNMAKEHPVF